MAASHASSPDAAAPALHGTQPSRLHWRLRKHADYQRIYKSTRKQFSPSMTYFAVQRTASLRDPSPNASPGALPATPRVGLTAGRVLGNAVERNRIKRRMREAIRAHLHLLPAHLDVVLHPRRTVLELEFAQLSREVERIFSKLASPPANPSVIQAAPQTRPS